GLLTRVRTGKCPPSFAESGVRSPLGQARQLRAGAQILATVSENQYLLLERGRVAYTRASICVL
ncbi:MAG TPA: hypothetical protein VM260_13310, partial [Pirellula sp.]|nr:hypothetical protein [Pirellula sp.]